MNTIDSAAEILGGEVVEEAPFNVNGDVIDLTSMDDVPDQSSKVLLPATNNVHLRIADVKVRSLSDGALKKEAIDIIKKYDSVSYAKEFARNMVKDSWNEVDKLFPESEAKEKIKAFADYLVERDI